MPHRHPEAAPAWDSAVGHARRYAGGDADEPWLVLLGPPGAGKTRLAAGVMVHRAYYPTAGPMGRWWVVPRLMNALRSGYEDGSYQYTLDALLAAPFVVLDDLGAGRQTDWVQEQLYMILDTRHMERLPTIVTTNLTGPEMAPRIADRVMASRSSYCLVVQLPTGSYR